MPVCKSESGASQIRCIAKFGNELNNAEPTHLCCDIVKQISVCWRSGSERREVTMPAIAEVLSTVTHSPDPRGCDLPTCPVCADSRVAAEASAYLADNAVSYFCTS